MSLCTLIACCCCALGPLQKRDSEDAAEHIGLLRVQSWSEIVARDLLVSFGMRTGPSAARELDRTDSSGRPKAAAVLALGCAQVAGERPRIEALASESTGDVKDAALWALGAYRSAGDVKKLLDLASRRATIGPATLLALSINGTPEALAHLEGVANDGSNPLSAAARDALGFAADRSRASDIARPYLELR